MFHDADFSGIIATEERTLDNLASPFGLEVMTAFLDRREPIGEVLRRLPPGMPRSACATAPTARPTSRSAPTPPPSPSTRSARPGSAARSRGDARRGRRRWPAERPAEAWRGERAGSPPLPEEPYLPLASYGREHRALFAGRDDDVERFARVLGRPDTRVLVLHGESGVGKSSFLNAGVIPTSTT